MKPTGFTAVESFQELQWLHPGPKVATVAVTNDHSHHRPHTADQSASHVFNIWLYLKMDYSLRYYMATHNFPYSIAILGYTSMFHSQYQQQPQMPCMDELGRDCQLCRIFEPGPPEQNCGPESRYFGTKSKPTAIALPRRQNALTWVNFCQLRSLSEKDDCHPSGPAKSG